MELHFYSTVLCSYLHQYIVQRIQTVEILMNIFAVEIDVLTRHIQCLMSENCLQLRHTAACKDVILREGMPEQVQGSFRHAALSVVGADCALQRAFLHLRIIYRRKEVVILLPFPQAQIEFQNIFLFAKP